MPVPGKALSLLLLAPILLVTSCVTGLKPEALEPGRPGCQIIFDAGSSGTRLYVYEKTASGWLKHTGPKSGALADPVRSIRGKTLGDAGDVVAGVVASLEGIRQTGPLDSKGRPRWQAFDWRSNCDVVAVSVLATAGMRMAEQQNPTGSEMLWFLLNQELSNEVGMPVTTRSVSGFEEGLYAWIAQREFQQDNDFGIAEMGGASFQVSFPCEHCSTSRQVVIKNQPVLIHSYSFAEWGQDEAWVKYGLLSACELGAGKNDPHWQPADCSTGVSSFNEVSVDVRSDIRNAEIWQWYLGGTFSYMNDDDIERFCREGEDGGYQPESACFRAVYLRSVLKTLGIPENAVRDAADWTLGAAICTATQCLAVE